MKYIGKNRTYIDTVTGIGIELKNNYRYPAAIIKGNEYDSVTLGHNAEIVITYSLGEIEKEWEM